MRKLRKKVVSQSSSLAYLRGEAVVKPRLNRVPTRNNITDLGYSAMYNDGKLIGWMDIRSKFIADQPRGE